MRGAAAAATEAETGPGPGPGAEAAEAERLGARADPLPNSQPVSHRNKGRETRMREQMAKSGGSASGGGGGYLRRGSLGSSLAAVGAAATAAGARNTPALRLAVNRLLEEKPQREENAVAGARPAAHTPGPARTGPAPPLHRRKLSFPAALHSSLLGLTSSGGGGAGGSSASGAGAGAGRRRFSNVGDAVSRKLSHTLGGWRGGAEAVAAMAGLAVAPHAHAQLAEQARALCALYVRLRLRRDGLFSRKCGLRRPHPPPGAAAAHAASAAREVFPVLAAVGAELERSHARAFVGVARQTGAAPAGAHLPSDKAAACALAAVARHLYKRDITWAKVVSLFCVAGALAVDCARQGTPAWAACLPDALADAVEEDLAPWIYSHGGWHGLSAHFRPAAAEVAVGRYVGCLLGALVLVGLLLALALRGLGFPPAV